MVAQRKAIRTTTPRRRAVAVAAQAQQSASGSGGGEPARDLLALQRLQAMRADALAWVAEIERRIATLEAMRII